MNFRAGASSSEGLVQTGKCSLAALSPPPTEQKNGKPRHGQRRQYDQVHLFVASSPRDFKGRVSLSDRVLTAIPSSSVASN